jgi:uncharacterized protein (DUF1330 family)
MPEPQPGWAIGCSHKSRDKEICGLRSLHVCSSDLRPDRVGGRSFSKLSDTAAEAIAKYGGRYLIRGGEVQTLEGSWNPKNIVVAEFPSPEQARAWYQSQEYARALEVRDRALRRNLIFVDGVGEVQ